MSGQSTSEVDQPHWDEDRFTLSFINSIINAHPDFTVTSHIGEDGHRYTISTPKFGFFDLP